MKIGVIADDFTGASDIALTLAEGGMQVVQFVGVPDTAAGDIDAGVIALKSRTVPADEAVRLSLAACDWLLEQGVEQIVFKICSTFDSTPKGNIGPVTAALAERLGEACVIVCPAFPENGRSVYMGHLFVGDHLLNESGMQDHPLTPMRDPDLRRVLAAQTDWAVAHVPARVVDQGADAIRTALPETRAMVIVDAISDSHLRSIGAAAQGRRLLTGGSGIAIGLPCNYGATPVTPDWIAISGPGVVLSGSCSCATRAQVTAFKARAPHREITAEDVMSGKVDAASLTEWVLTQPSAPLLYTSADPSAVRAAQDRFGPAAVAEAIESLFATLARSLADRGVTRIVVAGGETSGAVVEGLAVQALRIGPRLAAGVPAVRVEARNLTLALKSGNFGGPDFFTTALATMGGGT